MNNIVDLIERDLKTLWHPCSQMKDYEDFPPLVVKRAKGAYLTLEDGSRILDAISSWWCKSLGHGHPRLRKALNRQAGKFEHVILANTTNRTIVELSEKLTSLTKTLTKVFYASEGSSAVEIALKMAVMARFVRGQSEKCQLLALRHGYHGETLFALAVSDLDSYRKAYEKYLPKINFLENIPYVNSRFDALWLDCSAVWQNIEAQLNRHKKTLSVLILEPILQGAAGMRIYSQDFLKRLREWCTANDVYLIADEIMTGFGRTGTLFAYEHAGVEPDFVCLGKGLTSGYLPMSAVLTTDAVYQLFYDDYQTGKAFLHSHTHSGNALAAAVALESLQILSDENILAKMPDLENQLRQSMLNVAERTKKLTAVRAIGGVVAADLIAAPGTRLGYEVYRHAVKMGALLRPLGNTIYWLPPLTIKPRDIALLEKITTKAVLRVA